MDGRLRALALEVRGFMPEPEGLALYRAALAAPGGPLLEVGAYCGKSALYLGAAARERGTVLFSLDHHRGSEEHQPGWEYHDPALTDADGRIDTLPCFREAMARAGLEDCVIGVVGRSEIVARHWRAPLALLFMDGSHTEESARADYEGWTPHLAPGGLLLIHDVFLDPSEGGQAPRHVYRRALDSRRFDEVGAEGSLRILRHTVAR